jgi:polyferredoxin
MRASSRGTPFIAAPLAAASLTGALLGLVHWKVTRPMLLLERFAPGWGWVEILLLTAWAAWLTARMRDPASARRWRPRVWRLFSLVFFTQLVLGLLGVERCLMTGALHVPVPAVIVAGPLFRGGSWFMVVLFLSTVALVGPAWCSHLCYIGAWDDGASRARAAGGRLPRWTRWLRPGLLALVALVALLLRRADASGSAAAAVAGGFGVVGLGVMAVASTRTGTMAHCLAWCPLGWLANVAGRLSPFRLRFTPACTSCGLCSPSCRYDALRPDHIARRRVGDACSLCGDCLSACRQGALRYGFFWFTPERARTLFLVIVIALHASFLGLARL